MYNRQQIKAVIDVLKDKAIEGRPALQQVFEQGGYLWATNGYVALELGEVKDELKDKRITLDRLVGWYGTHKAKDTTTLMDLFTDNEYSKPDMVTLLHKEYTKSDSVRIDINYLNLAAKFLGVTKIGFEQKDNCYRIQPLESLSVASEAIEIKAYVMGLK